MALERAVKIHRVSSREAGSKLAAELFAELSSSKPKDPVGLATGSTMADIYKELEDQGYKPTCDIAFALDEYLGLSPKHANSYAKELENQFSKRLGFEGELLTPGQEPLSDPASFERFHLEHGPVSVQLLGLGSNGHIAFNEPGSSWDSETRVVELHEVTMRDNARFFSDPSQMPTRATTQGIATIKRANALLLVVFGESKLPALRRAFSDPGIENPASSIFDHPNLTLITDLDLS